MSRQEEAAWRELVKNNPFPAIHDGLLPPARNGLHRVELDGAVSIHPSSATGDLPSRRAGLDKPRFSDAGC